jgi:hypothetical protein
MVRSSKRYTPLTLDACCVGLNIPEIERHFKKNGSLVGYQAAEIVDPSVTV